VNVPLTTQTVALPRLTQTSVSRLTARSLNDGRRIGFLLEWRDAARDVRATRPDEFRDAAAVLFPVGSAPAALCMGSPGQLTNLWHWKADWQEDIDHGFQELPDVYPNFYKDSYPLVTGTPPYRAPADFAVPGAEQYFPGLAAGNPLALPRVSPVEDLKANGFGTATHRTRQEVGGRGEWADHRWRVVFVRDLTQPDPDSVDFVAQPEMSVAFAVWNGSFQEVGARKQLSALVAMRVLGQPGVPAGTLERTLRELNSPPTYGMLAMVLIFAGAAAAGSWARARARAPAAPAAGGAPGGQDRATP
jgi:hypothetical protein